MLTLALTAPATPTPLEEVAAAIEHIGPLQGLSLEERMWLARHGHEVVASAGEVLFEEGAPAEHMVLILKGEIHVRRQHGGPMALFIGRTGQMTGLLPYSRMKGYGGQGLAISPVWALLVHRDDFPAMLAAIPSMAQRSVTTLLDRVREVTRIEQQAEKLAALGKLAGNLAHELNNPASAAQRAAAILVEALQANRNNRFKLVKLALKEEQIRAVVAWEEKMLTRALPIICPVPEPGALDYISREEAVRKWLANADCEDVWEVAPQLAEQCIGAEDLDELRTVLSQREICISLQFFARYLRSTRAAETLVNSTARIVDLIGAVKDYSNLDRAPILEVDVPAGLDATLQMLRSRMDHVEVVRDYAADLPRISAYGGELNQVWTALIENALDALGNQGVLRITCRLEAEMLLVEIWDTGPGIPRELQERIFEPFFTTKAPGRGLGLGLDYAMRIVLKHRGHLSVKSEPGSTCFRVRLPLDQLQAY
ncbi:MAG TPA: ATP-binding protein [Terracidiphilus sp.]|jgi:signal transduction histidine kinase|nr:ATP-binding protein [Terracidiphilus sp.]